MLAKKPHYYKCFGQSISRDLGAELRLFNLDKDKSAELASIEHGWQIIEIYTDKEHGLREAFLLIVLAFVR